MAKRTRKIGSRKTKKRVVTKIVLAPLTLLESSDQLREGDYGYARNTLTGRYGVAKVRRLGNPKEVVYDTSHAASQYVPIAQALVLRRSGAGGVEILAGREVCDALMKEKSVRGSGERD